MPDRQKRRPWWPLVGLLLIIALGGLGWVFVGLPRDPINAFMLEQRRACEARADRCPTLTRWSASLIPAVFTAGTPREDILKRMAEAGYSRDGDYFRRRESLSFGCDGTFFITLQFDSEGSALVAARGSESVTCL